VSVQLFVLLHLNIMLRQEQKILSQMRKFYIRLWKDVRRMAVEVIYQLLNGTLNIAMIGNRNTNRK